MSEKQERREQRDLDLLRRWQRRHDPSAREQLVRRMMPLVRSIVRPYARLGRETADDLMQVGSLALVKAIDGFDDTRRGRFVSYAGPTIRGEIRRHFRDHTWSVHVPRAVQELGARVTAFQRDERSAGRPEASTQRLAEELDTDVASVREAVTARAAYRSLSIDGVGDDDRAIIDSRGSDDPGYGMVLDRDVVDDALGSLSARDRTVVERRYRDEALQREIGAEVGVSQMQVSRILKTSMHRMREHLTAEDGTSPRRAPATTTES